MKPALFYTLSKSWSHWRWRVLAVTSVSGSSLHSKVFGRLLPENQQTNAAGTDCLGKFATAAAAADALDGVETIWKRAATRIALLNDEISLIQRERDEQVKAYILTAGGKPRAEDTGAE